GHGVFRRVRCSMSPDPLRQKRTERVTQWITGGPYAVAVEVDAVIYPERPGEPYLAPETVRFLEQLEKLAEAGDVGALQKAGDVFVRLRQLSPATSDQSSPGAATALSPSAT